MSQPLSILSCYDLRPGDIVQHRVTGYGYVVVSVDSRKGVAEISNPQEWLMVRPVEECRR